jgi:dolichol kinase
MDSETQRQFLHIIVGCATIAMLLVMGRSFTAEAVFITIIIGTVLMNLRLRGVKIPLVEWFEKRFEREDAPVPGWGSACYATGALLALVFLHNNAEIAAIIFILGVGDGFSTLAGRKGRIKFPHNRKKTLEGSLAFVLASLPAYYFVGPAIIPAAVIGALAESLSLEDNLIIPIACTAFFLVAL